MTGEKRDTKYKSCTEYWLDPESAAFRGEFEQMYRDLDDPWGCFAHRDSLHNRLFCDLLFHERQFRRTLDLGCGLGGMTELMHRQNPTEIVGCDIAPKAVEQARARYPHIEFVCGNILTDDLGFLGKFDLIVMAEILWYLLEDLDGAFNKIERGLQDNGVLGIHQYFPHEQRYGSERIDGLKGFDEFFEGRGRLAYEHRLISRVADGVVLLATCKASE